MAQKCLDNGGPTVLQYYHMSIIWRIIGAVSIILGAIGKKKKKFQVAL